MAAVCTPYCFALKFAKITSQYYFVPQNLHKVLPSITLYYKACTKSFPVYYNLQLQNRISTPKRQKDDFDALFKRNFKRKITSAKIEKIFLPHKGHFWPLKSGAFPPWRRQEANRRERPWPSVHWPEMILLL